MLARDPPQPLSEPRHRRHDAHVAGGRLGDDRRDLATARGEGGLYRGQVVVGQHDRLAGARGGHAGRVGQGEGRHPRPGGCQQGVDVAVVAAGELDHHRPPGEPAGQAQRAHRRLGAGAHQPHLLDRLHARHDLLGEGNLGLGRRAEAEPTGGRLANRRDDAGMGVPEDHRPPRPDQVDVAAPVGVGEPRPDGLAHEPGRAANRAERPHWRVHPAGDHLLGAPHQRLRLGRAVPVCRADLPGAAVTRGAIAGPPPGRVDEDLHRLPQGRELGRGEQVDEVATHAVDVHGCHCRDPAPALVGEAQQHPASVIRAGLAHHPAALLKTDSRYG